MQSSTIPVFTLYCTLLCIISRDDSLIIPTTTLLSLGLSAMKMFQCRKSGSHRSYYYIQSDFKIIS
jgi:hypothetical protein